MENLNFDRKKNQHQRQNYLTFEMYFDWLQNIATNIFEWENLPATIPERHLEHTLFARGFAVFFEDPEKGYYALPATGKGEKNVYGEDISWYVNSYGYSKDVRAGSGVPIWNNNTKSPTAQIILAFAARLANVERVIDTNMNAQRTPVLLTGDERTILTLKNIYKKYEGNEPVIFGDKNFVNNQTLQSVNTLAPFVIDKLDIHKQNLWNEALTFLGINNANTDKRERLITAEVDANLQHIQSNLDIMLTARKRAADEINEIFGLNINVKVRGENEPVHNGTPVPDPAEL